MNTTLHAAGDRPDSRPNPATVDPTPPAHVAGPDNPGRGVAAVYQLRLPQVVIALSILLQSVDTLLAKGAFDIIVNESETASLLVAVAVAGIGALAAVKTGIALKERGWTEFGLIGAAWALIGVSMALLRFNTGLLSGLDENHPADMVVALLMLVLYLAAGAGIISGTAKVWDPRLRVLRSSRGELKKVNRTLGDLEPEYARVELALAHLDTRRAALDAQVADAQAKIATQAALLRARARLRIGEHLGDPAKTALYRQPAATERDGEARAA